VHRGEFIVVLFKVLISLFFIIRKFIIISL